MQKLYAIAIIIWMLIIGGTCQKRADWRGRARIRDQGTTGMCWAFATVSYLEATYNILTGTDYRLSPEQLSDCIPLYALDAPKCAMMVRPGMNGGHTECALLYVEKAGIMQEYNYPFTNAGEKDWIYNRDFITPIGVRNVTVVPLSYREDASTWLQILLLAGPVIASMDGNGLQTEVVMSTGYVNDIIEDTQPNHAVLIVALDSGPIEGETYVVIQNSWGDSVGKGGLFWIRVTDNGTVHDNLRILSHLVVADVYDLHEDGYRNIWVKADPPSDPIAIAALTLTVVMIAVALASLIGAVVMAIRRRRIMPPIPSSSL